LIDGIKYYDLALRLYTAELPTDEWLDLCGMLTPKKNIDMLISDINEGEVTTTDEIVDNLTTQARHNKYLYSPAKTPEYLEAYDEWLEMIRRDAEREFAMGDVDESQLKDFLEKVK